MKLRRRKSSFRIDVTQPAYFRAGDVCRVQNTGEAIIVTAARGPKFHFEKEPWALLKWIAALFSIRRAVWWWRWSRDIPGTFFPKWPRKIVVDEEGSLRVTRRIGPAPGLPRRLP